MSIDKTLRSIGRDIAIETLTAERNAAIAENQLLEHTNDVLHETCAQNTKLRAERDAAGGEGEEVGGGVAR